MNFRLCLSAAFFLVCSVCIAGPDSEKLASELIDVSGVQSSLEENFLSSIRPGLEGVKKNGGDDALITEMMGVAKKFYEENFHWALVKPQIIKAYVAELSDEDMKAITAFYQSPAGKVAMSKLPSITHKGTESAMGTFQSKMPELQGAMIAVVKKRMDAGTLKPK